MLKNFKYISLTELNAVLKLYNVFADRGGENSRIYKNNGLVYRVLDEKGNKVGVPIKASLIYNKPGLKFLEQKFVQNQTEKQQYNRRIKTAIDFAFFKKSNPSLQTLIDALKKEHIITVLRHSKEGHLYGITYVDFKNKCVFNGSDLGKEYSAKGIQQRCMVCPENKLEPYQKFSEQDLLRGANTAISLKINAENILDDLITPEMQQNIAEPFEMKRFKKKKGFRQRL